MPCISTSSKNNIIETPLYIVNECLKLIPIQNNDVCLDCCAGVNKIWFDNIPCENKYWCEILEGKDFIDFNKEVDYLVGNLPFNLFKLFFEKIMKLNINKGIGIICLENSITPTRLMRLENKGFYLKYIRKLKIKEWKFGFNVNYYYFEKKELNFCRVLTTSIF